MNDNLHRCPVCGAKAFIHKDVYEGYFYGWSVGCPRACIGDRTHRIKDHDEFHNARLTMFGFDSKRQAVEAWNRRSKNE